MPNMFDDISVEKAPLSSGANSVNTANDVPSVTKYKPDVAAQGDFMFRNLSGKEVFTGTEEEYHSLAKYGAEPNRYQSREELETLRAKNQSAWKQAGNALGQTIGTVIGDTVGGMGMLVDIATAGILDDKPFSNFITRAGDSISNYVRDDLFPIYRENPDKAFDMNDFSGWFFSQVPSIASSLSLMIPGTLLTKGVGAVGKGVAALGRSSSKVSRAMNWAKKATKLDNVYRANRLKIIANDGITAIGMRLGENYQEARGVAEQIEGEALSLFTGMSDEEFQNWLDNNPDIASEAKERTKEEAALIVADKAAMRNFGYNASNVFFDYMQLRAVNKALGQINRAITPRIRYSQNQALDRIASTGMESASQTLGQAAKGTIKDFAGKINRFINSSENLLLSELSEGVEEAINYVGQEEGTLYGRYLLGQAEQYNGAVSLDRIEKYLQNPQLYNAALWGVIGGVTFGGTMSAINNRKGGNIEEKQRISEISSREQVFNEYARQMQVIENGENPFQIERNEKGVPITYLDDGTVSQDPTIGTTRYAKVSPEEQEDLRAAAKEKFVTTLTLNAIRSGNYELLEDYIEDPRLKKKLVDAGLADEAEYDRDTQSLKKTMRTVLDRYINYSTALRSANIDDALLDVAISENIVNTQEADLLGKRIERLNTIQSQLENNIPAINEILDPMAKNRMQLGILEQYRREVLSSYNDLKNSNNPLDRAQAEQYLDISKVIESKVTDLRRGLSPMESLFLDNVRGIENIALGIEGSQEQNDLIKKQIEELDENDVALFKQAGKDFSLGTLAKQVRAINSEYMDNMGQILLDEIRRDNYRSRIITTNEQAKEFEDTRKKELEEAAKKLVKSAKKNLNDYVNAATEEELAKLEKALDNAFTEEESKDIANKSLSNAIGILNNSENGKTEISNLKEAIAKRRNKLTVQSQVQQQQSNNQQASSSTGEGRSEATTQEEPAVKPKPKPKAKPLTAKEKKLKETLDKVVSKGTQGVVNKSNIGNLEFTIVNPFASLGDVTRKPVKVNDIDVRISKFGNVSIDGLDAKGNIIADVTIEELNTAIAAGDITIVDTSKKEESTETDGTVLESAISDNDLESQRQRIEEINLIIDLYNQIQGNEVGGKTFTSLNDMMVYLQQMNPRAINLYNDIKILANRQVVDGKIINIDTEVKTPSDIVQSASKTLDDAVAEKKQESKDNGYFFNLVNLNDSKVYSRIGQLKSNDTVSVELDENNNLVVKSRGIKIGEFPKIGYNNGNVEVMNQGWRYTVKNGSIDFITQLQSIIANEDDSAKEFVQLLNNIRRLYRVRNNPEVEGTFGHQLNALQENEHWKNLTSLFGDTQTNLLDRIRHLNSIIFFNNALNVNQSNFSSIVNESLTNWMNKLKKSYTDINNLKSSISKTKSKKKRLVVGRTSSGSVIYAKDKHGNPIYRKFGDVTTSEATDGYRLVVGVDGGVADIKSNSIIAASRIPRGVIGMTVKDSEGRLISVTSRENTMSNSETEATEYTKRFNEGLDKMFHSLVDATLQGNTELHQQLLDEITKYVGKQKALYGYEIVGRAFRPLNKVGPTIYFNVADRNIAFAIPGETKPRRLMARMPNGFVPTNNHGNFSKMMEGVYSLLTRNVINSAIRGESNLFRVVDGKLQAKIPNILQDEWMDTGYSSYEEFVAKDGVLVTDLGNVTDSKGNIISNFNYTGDVYNRTITLMNPSRSAGRTNAADAAVSPIKEQQTVSPVVVPDPLASQDSAPQIGTLMEVAQANTDNPNLLSVVSALEAAGVKLSPDIETVGEKGRFAGIVAGGNTITLSNRFDSLTPERRVLTLIHEGVHYLLNDERANIEQSFGDLYDKFASFINQDAALVKEYGEFLNSGKPRAVAIEEFVVEAITNRTFARLLARIKYDSNPTTESNNLFTKIVDALVEIIGKIGQIDNTLLGEVRNRLSTIGLKTADTASISTVTHDDTFDRAEEDASVPTDDIFDIPDIDLDLDSSISDNYRQVDNFDSLIEGLNTRQKAIVSRLFDTGELSFVCS
jgi:hypothetical protein|nr:MAG TPA: reticulocyte binding/rhoptry protein [Crassvirales sp.]